MPHRILLLLGMVALAGCRNGNEGAVKLTVSYTGFKPGCIRVGVQDAAGAGEPRMTELPGKGERTGGAVTVAAFREAGWGSTLVLKAEAFEGECQGMPVTTTTEAVTVTPGQVTEKELKLAAADADADGFVSRATGGTDCDDTRAEVNPLAQERCNARDDDCDNTPDEDFEVGSLCDATDGCMGAWTCDTSGARTCEARPGQWRRDADGDGRGSREGGGLTACQQPAGYVPNSDDCDDTDPRRYLGAPELCNGKDDNCDTTVDEGMSLGLSCTGEGGCSGTRACAPDGGVMCDSPTPTVLYPDQDGDEQGATDAGVMSCSSTLPGHVFNDHDCDDTRAQVYLDAPEVCDGLDNDCDQGVDESFNVDASCDPGQDCPGKVACTADGGTECLFTTLPSTWYPDEDLDQRGKEDAGVSTCAPAPGHILDAGDCNDGNPFTYAGAPERCDGEDNDCNGTPEDTGVCGGAAPAWVSTTVGASNKEWRTVGLWGDGGVWVAGPNNRRARKRPDETSFTYLDNNCGGDWYSLWVGPTGQAYLGGLSGKLGIQGPDSTSCTVDPPKAGDSNTRGLWGYANTDGGVTIGGVGYKDNDGRMFLWDGGVANLEVAPLPGAPFFDMHGLSPDTLFAVGGPPNSPRIYRYSPISGLLEDDHPPTTGQSGLNAVHVVNPKLAFAVGEDRTVLKWDGQAWAPHPVALSAAGNNEDLSGVLAFGNSSLYVVSRSGNVFRFNGQGWEKVHSVNGTFYDIAGTGPDDLWVVGTDGRILHWPR